MKDFFVPHGRITRSTYIKQLFLFFGIEMIFIFLFSTMPGYIGQSLRLLSMLPYGYVIAMCKAKRLHDLGRPGYHYFLLFVPVYNIYLLCCLVFKKGEAEDNAYGTAHY